MKTLDACIWDVLDELINENREEQITADMILQKLSLKYPKILAAAEQLVEAELELGRDPGLLELEALRGRAEQAIERGETQEGVRLLVQRAARVDERYERAFDRVIALHRLERYQREGEPLRLALSRALQAGDNETVRSVFRAFGKPESIQ